MNKKRLTISSKLFIQTAAVYFGSVLNLGFYRFVFERLEFNSAADVLFAVSLPVFIMAPLLVFFSLITLPYVGKPLTALLLCLSAAANYAMFRLGAVIDADMYRNVVETNFREAADMATPTALLWIGTTGILPLVLLLRCKISYMPVKKELFLRLKLIVLSVLLLVCSAPAVYKNYVTFARNHSQIRRQVNTFNYIYAVARYYQRQAAANRSFVVVDENPVRKTRNRPHSKVLLLVVGETARAANFSLYGYERKTNPLLEKQNVVIFKDTSSCGTSTAISLPCMFSHLPRKKFDADDAKYTQNLVDLLAKAGCGVLWRENDDGCKGVCARIITEESQKSENKILCPNGACYDEILLDGLEEKLAAVSDDAVIVLHTIGSHGPAYYKRYPERFERFRPSCNTADLQNCDRREITNAYDNTILYTDYVVSSAIDILKKFPQYASMLIYVSDHGESLGENNLYLHGLPYPAAPDVQKKVPFILWASDKAKQTLPVDWDCLRKQAAEKSFSHDNLFHSVLGLFDIDTVVYDKTADIFAGCPKR